MKNLKKSILLTTLLLSIKIYSGRGISNFSSAELSNTLSPAAVNNAPTKQLTNVVNVVAQLAKAVASKPGSTVQNNQPANTQPASGATAKGTQPSTETIAQNNQTTNMQPASGATAKGTQPATNTQQAPVPLKSIPAKYNPTPVAVSQTFGLTNSDFIVVKLKKNSLEESLAINIPIQGASNAAILKAGGNEGFYIYVDSAAALVGASSINIFLVDAKNHVLSSVTMNNPQKTVFNYFDVGFNTNDMKDPLAANQTRVTWAPINQSVFYQSSVTTSAATPAYDSVVVLDFNTFAINQGVYQGSAPYQNANADAGSVVNLLYPMCQNPIAQVLYIVVSSSTSDNSSDINFVPDLGSSNLTQFLGMINLAEYPTIQALANAGWYLGVSQLSESSGNFLEIKIADINGKPYLVCKKHLDNPTQGYAAFHVMMKNTSPSNPGITLFGIPLGHRVMYQQNLANISNASSGGIDYTTSPSVQSLSIAVPTLLPSNKGNVWSNAPFVAINSNKLSNSFNPRAYQGYNEITCKEGLNSLTVWLTGPNEGDLMQGVTFNINPTAKQLNNMKIVVNILTDPLTNKPCAEILLGNSDVTNSNIIASQKIPLPGTFANFTWACIGFNMDPLTGTPGLNQFFINWIPVYLGIDMNYAQQRSTHPTTPSMIVPPFILHQKQPSAALILAEQNNKPSITTLNKLIEFNQAGAPLIAAPVQS